MHQQPSHPAARARRDSRSAHRDGPRSWISTVALAEVTVSASGYTGTKRDGRSGVRRPSVGSVRVQWHDDRIQVSDPGGFPVGVGAHATIVTAPQPRNALRVMRSRGSESWRGPPGAWTRSLSSSMEDRSPVDARRHRSDVHATRPPAGPNAGTEPRRSSTRSRAHRGATAAGPGPASPMPPRVYHIQPPRRWLGTGVDRTSTSSTRREPARQTRSL